MSATDWLWIVFGIMPTAFAVDLAVVGLVAVWFYYKRRRA